MVAAAGHGLYFSISGLLTKTEEFAPKTIAGRIMGMCQVHGKTVRQAVRHTGRAARRARVERCRN